MSDLPRELVVTVKPGSSVEYAGYEGLDACAAALMAELGPHSINVEAKVRVREVDS